MRRLLVAAMVCLMCGVATVDAQEHWTEGPVWECDAYRTLPGKFNDYMEYLRTNLASMYEEAEATGLVLDQRLFVQKPASPEDWDVMFCTAYKDGAAALDYDAELEAKWQALAAKHTGTADDEQREAMAMPRLEMRKFLGSNMMREVTLKPME